MNTKTIAQFLEDVRSLGGEQWAVVESVRQLMQQTIPAVTQEVKYGGILFTAGVPFCGVFAYQQHVSLELSHGAKIVDTLGHLEGGGKGRRHIKLRAVADIQAKEVAHYLPLAWQAACAARGGCG